jgi:hypothetical protein
LSGATDCADENPLVTSCVRAILDLEGHIGIKYYTKDQLDGHCNDVNTTFACLKEHSCEEAQSTIIKTRYAGIQHGFKYLCTRGREEYLKEGDCFSSNNIRNELNECERTNQEETRKLGQSGPSNYAAKCILDNAWVDCINDAVEAEKDKCDEDASEVAKFFAIRSLEPIAEVHGCTLAEIDDDDTDEHKKDDGANYAQLSAALACASLLLSLAL